MRTEQLGKLSALVSTKSEALFRTCRQEYHSVPVRMRKPLNSI